MKPLQMVLVHLKAGRTHVTFQHRVNRHFVLNIKKGRERRLNMTIQNRERCVNNIASHLNRPRRVEKGNKPVWTLTPQWEVYNERTQDELIDILEKQCERIHTTLKRATHHDLAQTIKETVKEHDGKTMMIANDHRN